MIVVVVRGVHVERVDVVVMLLVVIVMVVVFLCIEGRDYSDALIMRIVVVDSDEFFDRGSMVGMVVVMAVMMVVVPLGFGREGDPAHSWGRKLEGSGSGVEVRSGGMCVRWGGV